MHFKCMFLLILSTGLCYGDQPCNKITVNHGYICSCNSTYCDTIKPPEKLPIGGFHLYYTSRDSPGFNHKTGNFRMQAFSPFGFKYEVNKMEKFQKIRGFGGSFTDSFGAAINTLSNETRENLLRSFFSEDGIEYSVCRVVIGSSDFSLRNYSYLPDYDPTLKSFSLTEDDYNYKINHIKRAMDLSKKEIKFFGSAWNSPDWMKIGNSTETGYLKPEFRQLWADYYIKFLDSFRSEGIDFWALTTGNEPITLYMIHAMDILIMFPEEQREWIVNNLGPALDKANYSTKVIVLDDMRIYATWWMNSIMRDKRSEKYVLGVGLHYYMDIMSSLETLDILHEKYPNQEILYTESSINVMMNFLDQNDTDPYQRNEPFKNQSKGPDLGSWAKGAYYAMNIIENLNHWTTTYVDWNLGLNENGGPNLNGFPCDASIIVNETNNEFYKQPLFYIMGHFSKFILPDSDVINIKFINTTQYYSADNLSEPEGNSTEPPPPHPFPTVPPFSQDVQYIGVSNPDTSITIIFYNPKSSFAEVEVYDPERGYAVLNLEPKSLSTFLYW